jgi:hypothetical protein
MLQEAEKPSLLPVLNAAVKQEFLLNPVMTDRYFAAIASQSKDHKIA